MFHHIYGHCSLATVTLKINHDRGTLGSEGRFCLWLEILALELHPNTVGRHRQSGTWLCLSRLLCGLGFTLSGLF